MFHRWLVVTSAVLTTLATPDRAAVAHGAVTVEPTSKVKGQQEAELKLNCGDRSSGLVQYWHTPFGDLQKPGFVEPGPVLVRFDGTLVVSNCSRRHSGLYYCLLQDTQGTTVWPYQVHIHSDHRGLEEDLVASRSDDGVSQRDLVTAVVAAVLLTFIVGFSAGALSRTYVLRYLGAIRNRMRSPRQQLDQTDCSGVTMTTLPSWYSHKEAEPVYSDKTTEMTVSSMTSFPPVKPQRSFRQTGDQGTSLEGCGHLKEEEEEEGLEEENQEGEGTFGGLYLSGGDEEEEGDEEEKMRENWRKRREEGDKQEEWREEAKGDEKCDADKEEGWDEKETQRREEEKKGDEEEEERREEKGIKRRQEQEEEVQHPPSEEPSEGGDRKPQVPPGSRRRRVIRLYQYDEEGQRYRHLPEPAANEPGPTPRPRQRSVSLTRLNAIMAAASAGPLDSDGDAGRREETNFQMNI